jgi:hypothetical protein
MKKYLVLVFCLFSFQSVGDEQAEQIFQSLAPSLYQIRIIDKASGEKSAIGSGFQISADGLIATNYHVVSRFALHPSKYRMEYRDNNGDKAELTLQSVDVVNDLAIVKREVTEPMPFFSIAETTPSKGEELYSLGNPHDLGMIVVPGTYNGLKKESFNERIHFTGAINSGMSGGPVVNKDKQVVGINVATSGNQIGFLVPHTKLKALYQAYLQQPPTDIIQQMTEQLQQNQEQLISTLLNSEWQLKQLADVFVPIIDVPFIRCWGESNADKPDAIAFAAEANCNLDEDTYISEDFLTQSVDIYFKYLKNRKLTDMKFYRIYQQNISRASASNKAGKDDVTEFACRHDLVAADQQQMINKAVFCTRAYKKFPQLYDVLFIGASVDQNDKALISHFTLAGVSQDMAMAFTRKFMESLTWK